MKKYILLCCLLFFLGSAYAQPGISEMQQAQGQLSADFFSATDCSLILAAIIGLVGAVRIYYNWQMGQERITADIAAWFFAMFFVVLAGAFLQAVFGI